MERSISFWRFLKENRIRIPIIQRDYAQGRVGKEQLRMDFLNYLKKSLCTKTPIQLDFVYGVESQNAVTPLDGQQRLTTLWLLHWFAAYRAGKNQDEIRKTLERFSYETRDSSKDFCRELSSFSVPAPEGKTIADHIENQSWFISFWKQDPTIQSMLRMLSGTKDKTGALLGDGIEQVFGCCHPSALWSKLVDKDCPVTFYYLDLVGLKQSDDLYLKMNARGEQLTDFENFKADLVDFLTDNEELGGIEDGIPIKMDRDWANFFWKSGYGDEAFMAFINRFFLNSLIVEKQNGQFVYAGSGFEESAENHNVFFDYFYGRSPLSYLGKKDTDDARIAYADFSKYKFSDDGTLIRILTSLQKTLDGYQSFLKVIGEARNKDINDINNLTRSNWNTPFHFIPEYDADKIITSFKNEDIHKVKSITQNERVLFHAVCRFMALVDGTIDKDAAVLERAFARWMRVVWNLISDTRMRTITAMVSQLQLVEDLSVHAKNIYQGLIGPCVQFNGGNEVVLMQRFTEEKVKAAKIVGDKSGFWEQQIIKYETEFKGTISFLYTGEKGSEDWAHFHSKAVKLKLDELKDRNKNLLKKLVSQCSDWEQLCAIGYDFEEETWKTNLTNEVLYAVVHRFLLGYPSIGFSDPSHQKAFQDLTDTDIIARLNYGNSPITGCRLRNDKYGLVALFPSNAKSEMKKFVLGNQRNETLCELLQHGYKCNQEVDSTGLFWGWDVIFTNQTGQAFQWTTVLDKNNAWLPQLYALDEKKNVIPVINDANLLKELNDLKGKFGIAVPATP